jgi:hypothetical protein
LNHDPTISEFEVAVKSAASPESEPTDRERIEDCLLASGVAVRKVGEIADDLERLLEQLATRKASEAVRHLLRKLDGTAAGKVLQRVVLGAEESLEEIGRQSGISKVGAFKAEQRIRERLTASPLIGACAPDENL